MHGFRRFALFFFGELRVIPVSDKETNNKHFFVLTHSFLFSFINACKLPEFPFTLFIVEL
ncbi:hypothetical protein DW966_02785 [Bacteroides stercoris]|uniref:Uncharacterized protein n=1 Tax=Bacteroides stercoris TaxID=46506 RepID=A0A412DRF4_BACSE|nr:hypothetical protein DWY65_03135 [Bacteroides stercoris]RGZ94751.1 hypothetical protein DW966_02785 [Bacteroides stercoris]